MNIADVKELSNNELLDLYTLMVEYDHYDPLITPEQVVKARSVGIKTDMIAEIILARMTGP